MGLVPGLVEKIFDCQPYFILFPGIVHREVGDNIAEGGEGIVFVGRSVAEVPVADAAVPAV